MHTLPAQRFPHKRTHPLFVHAEFPPKKRQNGSEREREKEREKERERKRERQRERKRERGREVKIEMEKN